MIRVLVVDDSIFMRTALIKMLESDSKIRVVDVAKDGEQALTKVQQHQPDVVTMDIEMPGLSGLEAIKRLMKNEPVPIIVVSSHTEEGALTTFEALAAGAIDYIPKQLTTSPIDIIRIQQELLAKVRAAYQSRLNKHKAFEKKALSPLTIEPTFKKSSARPRPNKNIEIVVIGASTGGPNAVQQIIANLPPDFPVPILVVIHMPPMFTHSFAARLNQLSSLTVVEAENELLLENGKVYIARGGIHCLVEKRQLQSFLHLSNKPNNSLHRPSVDVSMLSVVQNFGANTLGVILTGMGKDGLKGIQTIYNTGGMTFAQDEGSCIIYGMPRVCVENQVIDQVLPIDQMAEEISVAVLNKTW